MRDDKVGMWASLIAAGARLAAGLERTKRPKAAEVLDRVAAAGEKISDEKPGPSTGG